jgi:hypothetical protein
VNPGVTVPAAAWPELPLVAWDDTRDTVHMWTQIVGKVRLALMPMVNHWWQVPLYVSSRYEAAAELGVWGRTALER